MLVREREMRDGRSLVSPVHASFVSRSINQLLLADVAVSGRDELLHVAPFMTTRFIAVMTADAPQSSRRRGGALRTATPHPASRTCPRSEGRRSSGFVSSR